MQITKENIEELILLYVDKELDKDTANALLLYLQQHLEHRELLEAYQDTVLQPDDNIVFGARDALKKPVGNSIPFNTRKTKLKIAWAAVAVLLLGAGLFTFLFIQNRNQSDTADDAVVLQSAPQPNSPRAADTSSSAAPENNTALNQSKNAVVKKDNAAQSAARKMLNTVPQNKAVVQSALPDDNTIAKDIAAVVNKLPKKIPLQGPEPSDNIAPPAVAQTTTIHPTEEAPALAVNDDKETVTSKGLLPNMVNLAGKIFNHKRTTTKLKINIGSNKEYIISLNY